MTCVGLDVHKESVQMAAVDRKGELLFNERIPSDFESVTEAVSKLPKARYVMESSSVWYGLYRHMTDTLGLDVVLSNPYATKVIATSLRKTDRIDAHKLADLLRGGYVAGCYVPDAGTVDYRQLTRHHSKIMRTRARMKNYIHGITLQAGFKSKAPYPFSPAHIAELEAMGDYRTGSYLREIKLQNRELAEADAMVRAAVRGSPEAQLLTSIPGVGPYTALVLMAEIGDVSRFADSHKLCAYAGIVPSVRNSADTVHHGRITKHGSRMMRWVLVEAVHTHARCARDSSITKFYRCLAKTRGTSKAAVAAASKMLRVVYWMLKERREFAECV